MDTNRAIAIPQSWIEIAAKQTGGLNNQPSCHFLPVPDYEGKSGREIQNSVNKTLKASKLQVVMVVLPNKFADGKFIKYWPDLFINTRTGPLITSVYFSDNWTGCHTVFNEETGTTGTENGVCNATCQYQPPYTNTLDLWVKAGAKSFHPGDYHKHEFLEALGNMKGHWLYWGHSDGSKLRAYQHLHTDDILNNRPATPLHSTLWFSCSTLNGKKKSNIALEWYLSGSTYCLMAGTKDVNTKDNQLFAAAWLNACRLEHTATIAGILYSLLCRDKKTFGPILKHYRLLGLPWIKIKIP